MKVEIDGRIFLVKFYHNSLHNNQNLEKSRIMEKAWGEAMMFGTGCRLIELHKTDQEEWKATANLHPSDIHQYERRLGRNLSLSRALHKAFPGYENKEFRKRFWQKIEIQMQVKPKKLGKQNEPGFYVPEISREQELRVILGYLKEKERVAK